MFSQCIYPNEAFPRSCNLTTFSFYSIKTRFLFGVKQCLADLHFILGFRVLADWSEKVFMVHNGIIGFNSIPHDAWRFDSIRYAHINFEKVAGWRSELWSVYKEEFSRRKSPYVNIFDFSPDQVRQMCFFPIRVPGTKVDSLESYCLEYDVQVERLWHIEKISVLPESELKSGLEIIVLPLSPFMVYEDAIRVASTVLSFFSTNL